ncbi:YceI family protein [Cognatiyoonia sp.]|uniref:YceI family protein n=1 Tax=Cognatiyoonia sp. TaxID=2211652 RepID=UPI003F69A693
MFHMTGTHAGFGKLTEAVRSEAVLSTTQNPRATFERSRVTRSGIGATFEGNLTLQGVVRPVTLDARIYRERGSDMGDLSTLVLHITGDLDRNEFGASGDANLV